MPPPHFPDPGHDRPHSQRSSGKGSLQNRPFGNLPDGRPVEAWTLIGAGGLRLEVITFGGIVTRLLVPDAEGRPADVVLGFSSLEPYLGPHPFFGAVAGRVAVFKDTDQATDSSTVGDFSGLAVNRTLSPRCLRQAVQPDINFHRKNLNIF